MRLIDSDRLPHKDLSDGKRICMVVFSSDIASAPTIDAVEVVRCEYCKHYVGEMFFGREVFWCNRKYKQGSGMMELTDADDYCSYGERIPNAEI